MITKPTLLDKLGVAALVAAVIGAAGSVGFMLHASQHPPRFLLVMFLIWVPSPFVALFFATKVSKRWPVRARAMLDGTTLVVTIGSLAVYLHNMMNPPKAQAAFVFVAVPLVAWLLIALVFAISLFLSARESRHSGVLT